MENYETFFARLRPVLTRDQLLDVDLAYTLAKHAHRWQCRKEIDRKTGKPVRYFEHLRGVALILIDEVGCTDSDMVSAALLHDSLEDTQTITVEKLERYLNKDVATIVRLLSKVPKEGYIERLLAQADWRTLMVKACDRLHNLRSLRQANEAFQRKQVDETKLKYFEVFDRMVSLAPQEYTRGSLDISHEIKDVIHGIERRLARQAKQAAAGKRRRTR